MVSKRKFRKLLYNEYFKRKCSSVSISFKSQKMQTDTDLHVHVHGVMKLYNYICVNYGYFLNN